MSYPNNDPQYRAWSSDDDETTMFDTEYDTPEYNAPQANRTQMYPPAATPGSQGYQSRPAAQPTQQPEPYQEPYQEPRAGRAQRPPRERHSATLGEMFRLGPMWIEMLIIAIVGGILYGMICWVADLLLVRLSDAVNGQYLAMDGTFEYTMRGLGFGFFVLVAALILMALAAAVNRPAQIFGWLFIAVLLWAVIVLLNNPLWNSIPEVALLLIGAGIIWSVMPMRVQSYRTNVPRLY